MSWTDDELGLDQAKIIMDSYKCKKCDSINSSEPIFSCLNGHFLCNSCIDGMDHKKCPICNNNEVNRHHLAEEFLKKAAMTLGSSRPLTSQSKASDQASDIPEAEKFIRRSAPNVLLPDVDRSSCNPVLDEYLAFNVKTSTKLEESEETSQKAAPQRLIPNLDLKSKGRELEDPLPPKRHIGESLDSQVQNPSYWKVEPLTNNVEKTTIPDSGKSSPHPDSLLMNRVPDSETSRFEEIKRKRLLRSPAKDQSIQQGSPDSPDTQDSSSSLSDSKNQSSRASGTHSRDSDAPCSPSPDNPSSSWEPCRFIKPLNTIPLDDESGVDSETTAPIKKQRCSMV